MEAVWRGTVLGSEESEEYRAGISGQKNFVC